MTRDPHRSTSPTRYFPEALKRYRKARGWTQPDLADRCKAAGLDWDRSIVANVENGRRGAIALHELLILAYLLAVPPVLLILPMETGELVEVVPGVEIHPDLALKWITGEVEPVDSTQAIAAHVDMGTFARDSRPLALYRRFDASLAERDRAEREVSRAERVHGADSGEATEARRRYAASLESFVAVLAQMEQAGMRPPALGQEFHDTVAEYGLQIPATVKVLDIEGH